MRLAANDRSADAIDFVPLMDDVARRLLGEPNRLHSRARNLRWGTHGSLSVDLDKGAYHDKEANQGGGVLDLIMREQRCDKRGALEWLEHEGLIEPSPRDARPRTGSPVFYDYDDPETGEIAYRVERRGKGMSPPFLQHGPNGRGGFHATKGCMSGVKRLPYRATALRSAPADAIVFVVEGEKDADRLAAAGLIATTNSEGAGKFRAELAPYFGGKRVVVLPDNDQPGADHASDVVAKLTGTAASNAVLALPNLPPKGDVSDWLAAGGTVNQLSTMAAEALAKASEATRPETFPIADLAAWANTSPQAKAFLMAGYIPSGEVTLFTGAGGTNKSTFGLQLCAASAAGVQMLGAEVEAGPSLYVTAEDDDRENHWRLVKIAAALGTTLHRLAGRLHVVSLRGRLWNELATFDGEARLHASPAFILLRATIEATGARLVVLDNVAHLFTGNENDRGHVTAFVNLLYQLCRDLGCSVMLIAHPNKIGNSYSGSTAWLNAVRSQVVLEKPEDGPDPDARLLRLGKANYARADQTIKFRWHDFALKRDADLPANVGAEIAANIAASHDNDVFLRCLDVRNQQERAVSENKASRTYAPREFAAMAESKGIGSDRLEAAMDRLYRIGAIERGHLWTAHRKPVEGLRRVSGERGDLRGDPAATGCADVRREGAPTFGDVRRHTPHTPIGTGAAHWAAALDPSSSGKTYNAPRWQDEEDPAADFSRRPRF